jgi:small-conductance mechanosensitive channel
MRIVWPKCLIAALWAVLLIAGIAGAENPDGKTAVAEEAAPVISLPENVGGAITKEAAEVTQAIQKQAASLFIRSDLGWDLRTIDYLNEWMLGLLLRVPELMRAIAAQGRLLGIAGSLVMLTFIVAVIYSLIGQHHVMRRIEAAVEPVRRRVPQEFYPVFIAAARVVVAAAIPLVLLGAYALISSAITYRAAWFALAGDLLLIWSAAALAIRFLRELLARRLFKVTAAYGQKIFRLARLVLLYGVACVALLQAAEAFAFRRDVVAFLRFAFSVSVVCLFLLLVLNKRALLSFLPELPYRSYRRYVVILNRYYYPLIGLSFVLALAWCFGYREFGRLVLVKIWSTVGALVLLSLIYHSLRIGLNRWSAKIPPTAEAAHGLFRSARSFMVYAAGVIAASLLLNMIGLLEPLERLLSFQVVKVGGSALTFWTLIQAVLVLLFFIYGSRLLQAYLDYKLYPALGVDSGLGYAINTILRLAFLALGFLVALNTLGVNLGYLLVFAGAIGVGIGLGLQNMASHLISGLIIIFSGQIRKGDWIKVEDGMGTVTDIHLMSTRVRTRGNVEYLIPNATLLSNTVVNYSLSSPLIWTSVPVGVSYNADPQEVERILMAVAESEPTVSRQEKPRVLFVGFGESSLDFMLAAAMDVRLNAERVVQSNLYFAIFEAFRKAGIEIPYPQRDIHVHPPASPASSKLEAGS